MRRPKADLYFFQLRQSKTHLKDSFPFFRKIKRINHPSSQSLSSEEKTNLLRKLINDYFFPKSTHFSFDYYYQLPVLTKRHRRQNKNIVLLVISKIYQRKTSQSRNSMNQLFLSLSISLFFSAFVAKEHNSRRGAFFSPFELVAVEYSTRTLINHTKTLIR